MNSFYIILTIQIVMFVISIITVTVEHNRKNTKEKVLFYLGFIGAIVTFISFFIFNDLPAPTIDRKSDYSEIIITSKEHMRIEYRISTSGDDSDQWIEYTGPFKLNKSAIIYTRTRALFLTSRTEYRDVYVSENSLVYFSNAERPGDSIVDIDAEYNYTNFILNNNPGNHYVGYKIKKSDLTVIGTDLNGNRKEITDFKYTPNILHEGKNLIEIEYFIASGISINTKIPVSADKPELIKLEAKYIGSGVYLDTILGGDDFLVEGLFEDGTREAITGYAIEPAEVIEGENKIKISKNNLEDFVILSAMDRDSIIEQESEPNNDISTSNQIDVNIKYSGHLDDEDDNDYYKLKLNKKGKIVLKLTHPKMDDSDVFWDVSLLGEGENVRLNMKSRGGDVDTLSSPIRVMPGVYYIRINNYRYSSEKYTLTVSFQEEDDSYENEPNDDLSSQAMVINLNKEYTGNLTNENDVDYYKFSIREKRKIWITFSHNKTSTDDILWKILLFDDTDGYLLNFSSTGTNASISSDCVRLPPGNYYIKIESYYWSDLDYKFKICEQKETTKTEDENNDDFIFATPLSIDSSIIGNLQSENDVDIYKFKLPTDKPISINFSHNMINDDDVFWNLELFSAESGESIANVDDEKIFKIQGNSSNVITSNWSTLPAGIYYLKIYTYRYSNSDYKVTIKS